MFQVDSPTKGGPNPQIPIQTTDEGLPDSDAAVAYLRNPGRALAPASQGAPTWIPRLAQALGTPKGNTGVQG